MPEAQRGTGANSFGSYYVFRKLEQTFVVFKKARNSNWPKDTWPQEGKDVDRAGAMIDGAASRMARPW